MESLFLFGNGNNVSNTDRRCVSGKLHADTHPQVELFRALRNMMRFAEREQLKNLELWKTFAEQFRTQPDGNDQGWRGEYWGKMMRGGALICAATGDAELYGILRDSVLDMLSSQEESGRISTYSQTTEFSGWDLWSRKYVLLGMQYFLDICESDSLRTQVITSMCLQVDYLIDRIGSEEGKLPIDQTSDVHGAMNSFSVLEPIVKLYKLTGKQKYLDFASYLVSKGGCSTGNLFDLALEDQLYPYQYPYRKAYEMISCFEGLLEYYEVTGEEKWRTAVEKFAYRLLESDITVIGSAGCTHELLDCGAIRQTDASYYGVMQETCVTVTWMNFCYRMLLLNGDSVFADCFEQSLWNAYAGVLNTNHILNPEVLLPHVLPMPADKIVIPTFMPYDSYSPLMRSTRGRGIGGSKLFANRRYYGCCACIGSMGIGLVPQMSLMSNDEGLVFHLYHDSVYTINTPAGNRLHVRMETEYPTDGMIRIILDPEMVEIFSVSLRIPLWSKKTQLFVNGQAEMAEHGYTVLRRTWHPGDEIILIFDMRVRILHPMSDDSPLCRSYLSAQGEDKTVRDNRYVAFCSGPLMLSRDARISDDAPERVLVIPDEEGFANARKGDPSSVDFSVNCIFTVPMANGSTLRVIDYASAGRTWNDTSACEVWLEEA